MLLSRHATHAAEPLTDVPSPSDAAPRGGDTEPRPPTPFNPWTRAVQCLIGLLAPRHAARRGLLQLDDETGFVECGYCDRRFVLEGGPADQPGS